ncbi:GATOR complex protein NPRL2-like isoform X3 [Varroa jacobsoni]|uniref:Nitrogen permease regulator 2-like protein n=1 Tax=Varroa destructor TaxID=109461 RepID=A0A7M7K7V8_VARDE|nr:GATOR complex protein NPRL2-like isoform X3 [Varroa destructor]XP_022699040.1 GATOR complex protein NPRL2-like isoform X3 [Varroa jacobsoni]
MVGPKITFQYPENYVQKEAFDLLKVYLIPKEELQHKLITINMCSMKILGFPAGIKDDKYERNQLMFNLCFVCSVDMRTIQYEAIVRKLAHYLVTLERESQLISNPKMKPRLLEIISRVRHDLDVKRSASIQVTPATTIYLKVNRVHADPQDVHDHHVAVFTENRPAVPPAQWDLTTQRILPLIDGFRHVLQIAQESDVDIDLVKACLRNLIYYDVIKIIPLFLYSAIYVATPLMQKLYTDRHLQADCVHNVQYGTSNQPTFRDIFSIYARFNSYYTVADICNLMKPRQKSIDERKLVQFGVIHGLIKRLHKFPIDESVQRCERTVIRPHQGPPEGIRQYFTGEFSFDQICCKTGHTYHELEEIIEKENLISVCVKSQEDA